MDIEMPEMNGIDANDRGDENETQFEDYCSFHVRDDSIITR